MSHSDQTEDLRIYDSERIPVDRHVKTDFLCTLVHLVYVVLLMIILFFVYNQGTPPSIQPISTKSPIPTTPMEGSVVMT